MTSGAMAKAQDVIATSDIAVFSKVSCGFSSRAKRAIARAVPDAKERMVVIELDMEPDGREVQAALLELTGQRTVPNIFVKGKHVGGCDDTMEMLASGAFTRMLEA